METSEQEGRALYEAVKKWLEQFDPSVLDIQEQQEKDERGYSFWHIRIEHLRSGRSMAMVAWTGEPVQVYLGQCIWFDRLDDDPKDVLPLLDAAADGRITEELWRDGDHITGSRAEIHLADGTVTGASYGWVPIRRWAWARRKWPPTEVVTYQPWVRKPVGPPSSP